MKTLFLWTLLATPSFAAEPGIPVIVRVVDSEENPISTAVIRHPVEKERHGVNPVTGEWQSSVLYMSDGTELLFEKGTQLELEISAPGYVNSHVTYFVRNRKNRVTVTLEAMDIADGLEKDDPWEEGEIIIGFQRDRPLN